MVIKSFHELIENMKSTARKKTVVIVSAADEHTLEAVIQAKNAGIVQAVLIGEKEEIQKTLSNLGASEKDFMIVDEKEDKKAAEMAVELIHQNKADFIMKGKIQTGELLKAVVDKEKGLRTGNVMSHMAIYEIESYKKLLFITDGGMNIYPTLYEKKQIIQNSVSALQSMGYEKPKVAALCAVETVNPKMQETIDARDLKIMGENNEIKNCIIEGPISYDLVMSKESAAIKGYESPVVEEVDILLMPNIATGNILGKSLSYSAGAKMAGMILGAKVPIVLTSRGSTSEEKFLSIVLSASACNNN